MVLHHMVRSAVLIVIISLAINANYLKDDGPELRDAVLNDFLSFDQTGIITAQLFGILKQMPLSSIFTLFPTNRNSVYDGTICIACRSVVDALIRYESTHSKQEVRDLVISMCVQLQLETEEVCTGVIDLNVDSLLYIFHNAEGDISSRFCGILLQGNDCSKDDPTLEWTVNVDLGKKPKRKLKNDVTAADALQIVQLSDIHHDPIYLPEGNAVCGQPMCCRSVQGNPGSPEAAAGYWGDYRSCDTSWHAFEDTLQQIKNSHKDIDYIYMTGDIIDHAVWDTSIEKNSDAITRILKQLKTEFPNTPVYPVLGNHEPSPLNVYAPHTITEKNVTTMWLYELVAELWTAWLPQETKETILKGGYYTAQVRPGFRVIGLNNNVCYNFNWWLVYNPKDQDGQLEWLAKTLLEAEKNEEKVHILGHIPSGDSSCLRTWSREFHKIIDRFEDTVTANFNGHTHNDHFHVYYAMDDPKRPNNVAFNGGSVTPFTDLNSNYKIYTMDASTFTIQDIDTWIFNLTDANIHGNAKPNWYKLYAFKDTYGADSLSPTDLDKLTHKMAANKSLLGQYAKYYVKAADTAVAQGCNDDCLKSRLCYMAQAQMGDNTQCNVLMAEYETANNGGGIGGSGGYIETIGSYLKPIFSG